MNDRMRRLILLMIIITNISCSNRKEHIDIANFSINHVYYGGVDCSDRAREINYKLRMFLREKRLFMSIESDINKSIGILIPRAKGEQLSDDFSQGEWLFEWSYLDNDNIIDCPVKLVSNQIEEDITYILNIDLDENTLLTIKGNIELISD